MKKTRNSLFPQESLAFSASTLTSGVNLFGTASGSSELETRHDSFDFSNLHQLSSEQISRLIGVKYSSDPIRLIRQLSLDLAQKEAELQSITKTKFTREQRLYKLCNEYGNLSTLEIDHKLNQVEKKTSEIHLEERTEPKDDQLDDPLDNETEKDRIEPPEPPQTPDPTPSPTESEHDESSRSKSWTRSWFHSTEDLSIEARPSNSRNPMSRSRSNTKTQNSNSNSPYISNAIPRNSTRAFPLNFIKPDRTSSVNRMPVELDSINSETFVPEVVRDDVQIDKYGFFTDIKKLSKKVTEENKPEKYEQVSVDSQTSTAAGTLTNVTATNSNITPPPESSAILIGNKTQLQTIDQLKHISQQHDSINLQYEQEWDNLINAIRRDFLKYLKNSDLSQMNNVEMIGIKGLNLLKLDLYFEKHSKRTNYYNQLIELINKFGISAKYRLYLWLELSGAKNLKVNGEFQQLLNEVEQAKLSTSNTTPRHDMIMSNIKQIDLDLHRTLPLNYHFNNLLELKPGPNFYKLQRILYAFVAYRIDIGYFQGMNKIIGNLLLLLSKSNDENDNIDKFKEEDVFWIFVGLIEEILPKYSNNVYKSSTDASSTVYLKTNEQLIYFNSLLNIKIDQSIFHKVYLQKFLPDLFVHFAKLSLEVEIITMNWWLTLFIDLKFLDLDIWFKLFENLLIDNYIINEHEFDLSNGLGNGISAPSQPHTPSKLASQSPSSVSLAADDFDQQDYSNNRSAIKLISLSLSIFKALEPQLLNMTDSDEIYQFLSSNNNSNKHIYQDNQNKSLIKYSELMKYHQSFMKNIKVPDFNRHRVEFIQKESS